MYKENKLKPSTLISFYECCEREGVGVPHCILLDSESGEPINGQKPLPLSEAIDATLHHSLGLIPASIKAVILETDQDVTTPIELIVGEHRDVFKAISPTIPKHSLGRHAWLQCDEAERFVDEPVSFRGLKVGEFRGSGNWVVLTEDLIQTFLACGGFWREGAIMLEYEDVSELTTLTCSFFDMMRPHQGSAFLSECDTYETLLAVYDRGQLRQAGHPFAFRRGLYGSKYEADLSKQLNEILS